MALVFYVEFDDLFETVGKQAGNRVVDSKWQTLSGFQEAPPSFTRNYPVSEGAPGVSSNFAAEPADIPIMEFEAFDDKSHAANDAEP